MSRFTKSATSGKVLAMAALTAIVLALPAVAVASDRIDDFHLRGLVSSSIEWAIGNGIVDSESTAAVHPDADASLGDVVVMLNRYDEYAGQSFGNGVPGPSGSPSGDAVFMAKTGPGPLVFPMNIDPADTAVPATVGGGPFTSWNGAPYSWQCYGTTRPAWMSSSSQPVNSFPPSPVLTVAAPVAPGDLLFITADWGSFGSPGPDVAEFCSSSPSFVPFATAASPYVGERAMPPSGRCDVGLLVDGSFVAPESGLRSVGRGSASAIVEMPTGGTATVELASLNCAGQQWNNSTARLIVERKTPR